ncbi:angiopoietin-related protein 7 [Drosophila mojavensis]|uniref:Fibrinogen C-terminal domain-containing protein n=1 Tax=Drosophila mojavensis TaxID=7230 RepID=B4L437_DROMO|nr:angiopoietin-related protein 7 [Drosophila mojavensis]EDW07315.2 uncharacterized protein Dmoj_GI15676 [Drosophila mojavensis]
MIFKQFILWSFLMLTIDPGFGVELQSGSLKSEFSVKCFGIMQPLLQDIAIKKEKIDRCDAVVQGRDDKLAELQVKYDQMQMQLAVAETAVREKERQIVQQQDLCNSHKNNSNVKDELIAAYRQHVKDKASEIDQLQRELKAQAELLGNCSAESKQKDARIGQLQQALAETSQLTREEAARNMTQSAEQIQQLRSEARQHKDQLDSLRSQLRNKEEYLEKLQSEIEWTKELQDKLKNREEQIEKLEAELAKKLEQRDAFRLQLNASELLNEQKTAEVNSLRSELNKMQLQLSEYKIQIDRLQSTDCYWFGNSSAVHQIRAPGIKPFDVLCDSELAGPGWTVIQRRFDGSENFYRNWTEYRNGFGDLHGEFFIGMEKLYRLTLAQSSELYVHLESFDGSVYYARYSDFSIGSESESYNLKLLGTYSGNAGDGLYYAKYRKFSTFDVDNDRSDDNCGILRHGAWWYDRCGLSNLNGQYFNHSSKDARSIFWLGAQSTSFKKVQMMLRPKTAQFT